MKQKPEKPSAGIVMPISSRVARTIRSAILTARKQAEQAAAGWVGVQSGDLVGLYGKAYLRTWEAYEPKSQDVGWGDSPPGIYEHNK